ncbi:unnamed protein product, partial [Brenthis ino]
MIINRLFMLFILTILGSVTSLPLNSTCESMTPNSTCMNIYKCPLALSLIRLNRDVVKEMTCGFDGTTPKVCCPVSGTSIIFTNLTEEIATRKPSKVTTQKIEEISQESKVTTMIPEINSELLPSRKICGQVAIRDRIVGGLIAGIDEFPWLARIKYRNKFGEEYYACSASLITNQYLITAAHCLTDKIGKPISVRLGEWDEQTERDCQKHLQDFICNDKPVDKNISEIFMHDDFDVKSAKKGDIALLKLDEPIPFTEFITPVCLPSTEYVTQQDYVLDSSYWTAGWGITEFDLPSPLKRKVSLNTVSSDICHTIYSEIPEEFFETLICAGGVEGKDTCSGDSGGSLVKMVTEDYEKNWYLFGITSTGPKRCGSEGMPGIYTRITSYMDWIRKTIRR